MMLYYACLAAYDDASDTHTTNYQPLIAYLHPAMGLDDRRGRVGRCGMPGIFSILQVREIRELIVHPKLSDCVDSPRSHRYARSPERASCMLLYRFSSPGRLKYMIQIFVYLRVIFLALSMILLPIYIPSSNQYLY